MKPTSYVHTLNPTDVPIARAILVTSSAAVALAGAMMYALVPMPLRPGAQPGLVVGLALAALILGASAWRLNLARLPNAILLAAWVVWAAVGVVGVALGEGFNSLVFGYLLVAMTMLAVQLISLSNSSSMRTLQSSVANRLARPPAASRISRQPQPISVATAITA